MGIPGFAYVAGGNISPHRFVKSSTTEDHTVLQAGTGESVIGISHKGVRNAPYGALDDGYAAIDGESGFRIYLAGEICHLELGTGGATAGDLLKSDTNGKGVTADTDQDIYGARALENGAAGDVIKVQVVHGYIGVT